MMQVRMNSQVRQPFRLKVINRRQGKAVFNGWLLIGGFTAVLGAWLIYRVWIRPAWLLALPPLLAEFFSLAETAAAFTLAFLWIALWWRRRSPPVVHAPQLSLSDLLDLSPADFEQYVAHLFRLKGYRVQVRGRKGDMALTWS